jgi:hypothetical protein
MDLSTLFTTTDYTFLELQSGTGGVKVIGETDARGYIKNRNGFVQSSRGETFESNTTLHMLPDEAFINTIGGYKHLEEHGVRFDGKDYRIEGVSKGVDPDTGEVAFYRCTLKRESLWASALPLE